MKLVDSKDPVLTAIALDVPHGEDRKKIAEQMFEILWESEAVGLAAPQVGISERIILVNHGRIKNQVIINPVITRRKPEMTVSKREGCLSFPGKRVDKKRNKRVTVEGFDLDWNPVKLNGRDLIAFIFQHEIDHLNGINIV